MTSQIGQTPEFDLSSTHYDSFEKALNHAKSDQFVHHAIDKEGSPYTLASVKGTFKKAEQLPKAEQISLIHKLFLAIVSFEEKAVAELSGGLQSKIKAVKDFTSSVQADIKKLIKKWLEEINAFKEEAKSIKHFWVNNATMPKMTIEDQFETIPENIHTLKPNEQLEKLSQFYELTDNISTLLCPIQPNQKESDKVKTLPKKLITGLYHKIKSLTVTGQALKEVPNWILEELQLKSVYFSNNEISSVPPQKVFRRFRCNGGRSGEFDGNLLSEKALETLRAEANATEDNGEKLPPIRLVYDSEGKPRKQRS